MSALTLDGVEMMTGKENLKMIFNEIDVDGNGWLDMQVRGATRN